jgi:hypothetical protein
MDKLRRALSGNDGGDEERGFVAQVKTNCLKSCKKTTCWCNSWSTYFDSYRWSSPLRWDGVHVSKDSLPASLLE